MKFFINSGAALLYPEGFLQRQELEALLRAEKIELQVVEEEALGLSLATLAGAVNAPPPSMEFEGDAPAESCLVFSGLKEEKLRRIRESIAEAGLDIPYQAVITNENRSWAFGALMQEMEKEKKQQ